MSTPNWTEGTETNTLRTLKFDCINVSLVNAAITICEAQPQQRHQQSVPIKKLYFTTGFFKYFNLYLHSHMPLAQLPAATCTVDSN